MAQNLNTAENDNTYRPGDQELTGPKGVSVSGGSNTNKTFGKNRSGVIRTMDEDDNGYTGDSFPRTNKFAIQKDQDANDIFKKSIAEKDALLKKTGLSVIDGVGDTNA